MKGQTTRTPHRLVKSDYRRRIDGFIDYFGDHAPFGAAETLTEELRLIVAHRDRSQSPAN